MASDLTPEEIASMRKTLDSGHFVLLGEDGYRLLDMAERCAKAERRHQESTQWYASRWERLRAEILPVGSEAEKKACDIMANGKLLMDHAPESPLARAIARAEMAEAKAANLRERAERCADYDSRLTEVMPKDFKDWHQNSRREWPEVAAWTITNLRQREDWAHAQMARALAEVAKLARKCTCDLRTKLVGDGCHICNPEVNA